MTINLTNHHQGEGVICEHRKVWTIVLNVVYIMEDVTITSQHTKVTDISFHRKHITNLITHIELGETWSRSAGGDCEG